MCPAGWFVAAALSAVGGPSAGVAQTLPTPVPAAAAAALPRLVLTAAMLDGLARRTVTVAEEGDAAVAYSGVDLGVLLAKYGAPAGAGLRGAAAADYALLRAADGYRTVFSLAELDPTVTPKIVLLADQRNGVPLDARLGPFRVVVPDEKHHVRWIRNVVEVDVVSPSEHSAVPFR